MSFDLTINGDSMSIDFEFQECGRRCEDFRFVNGGIATTAGDDAMIPRNIDQRIKWGIDPDYDTKYDSFTYKTSQGTLEALPVSDTADLTTNWRISDGTNIYEMIGWHDQWVEIDWGDNTVERHDDVSGSKAYSHTYDSSREWTISITGSMLWLRPDWRNIVSVCKLTSSDLHIVGTDRLFYYSTFDDDISSWDLSTVTDTHEMFHQYNSFNQDIGSWDVSNVVDMSNMFSTCYVFDQNLNSWDVSNVQDMGQMFYARRGGEFNGNITDWDVSNVKNMFGMFLGQFNFNQDIGSWNVSNVNNMSGMFDGADEFLQDLSMWDVSNVTDWYNVFARCPMGETDSDGNYKHLDLWPPKFRDDPVYAT